MKHRYYHLTLLPLLFASILFFVPVLLTGQSAIAYYYDHAGNRIARRVIIMPPRAVAEKSVVKPDSVIEILSDGRYAHIRIQ